MINTKYIAKIIIIIDILLSVINFIAFLLLTDGLFNINAEFLKIFYINNSLLNSVIIYPLISFVINVGLLITKFLLKPKFSAERYKLRFCFTIINLIISIFFIYLLIFIINEMADVKLIGRPR
jgi:uncharacterized membrane protein YbhN (UPF0104 family)